MTIESLKHLKPSIDSMVAEYVAQRTWFANLAKRVSDELTQHEELRPYIHSWKQREKDPSHLEHKLYRKALDMVKQGRPFNITAENIFSEIDDLAGVRLLHAHTEQLKSIHPIIVKILKFYKYKLRSRPKVYTWDSERTDFLKKLGLVVDVRKDMYTSVHYVVEPFFKRGCSCEIQVRTLAEELWGEVSHNINYPNQTNSVACREQLAALARVASGCTRLVDSIYASASEYKCSTSNAQQAQSGN